MHQTTIALCLLIFATSCTNQTESEPTKPADEFEWFKRKYLEEEKVLYEQYVVNRKWVVDQLKGYKSPAKSISIASRDSSRNVRQFETMKITSINIKGEHHHIREEGNETKYKNKTTVYDRQPELIPYYWYGSVVQLPNLYPMSVSAGNLYNTELGDTFRRSYLGDDSSEQFLGIQSVKETTFESHKALAVESRQGVILYYDLDNHLAYLGYHKKDLKSGGTFEYVKSDHFSFPVPKQFYTWQLIRNEQGEEVKLKETVFEVLEFSDYTPTADDFDVEKQTGLKPIPPTEFEVQKKTKSVATPKAIKQTDPQERWVYIIVIGSALLIIACIVAFQIAQMRARRITLRKSIK